MRKIGIIAVLALMVTAIAAVPALAQSGHFVGTPTCTDIGTQLQCTGKVAGLGGETFEIVTTAPGTAIVECENPAGNVAPGQDTDIEATGTTGPVPTTENGRFNFNVSTATPTVPDTPTCPNARWDATVVDVVFDGTATLQLFEDGTLSDTATATIRQP